MGDHEFQPRDEVTAMKKIAITIAAAMIIMAMTAGSALAESFIVYDFKAKSSQRNDARVMAKILATELNSMSDTRAAHKAGKKCYSVSCAGSSREKYGVDAVVVGQIERLQGEILFFYDAVWADDVITEKINLANLEEFDRLAPRIAEAIRNKKTFAELMGIDSVSKKEEHPSWAKQTGDFSIGLGLGAMAPLNGSYLDAAGIYQFSFGFKYELLDYGLELDLGYGFGESSKSGYSIREFPIDFSFLYYFSKRDRGPFIGATFGVHGIDILQDHSGGFDNGIDKWAVMTGGFVGYELGRAQTVSFHGRIGYKAYYVDFEEYGYDNNIVHGPFLMIGLSFF
jgi:hypothetical protein